jgi:hypothetical protein
MSKRGLTTFSLSNEDRGGIMTTGAIVLSIVIISGVAVAYAGVAGFEEQRAGMSQQGAVERPVDDVGGVLSSTLLSLNHDPSTDPTSRDIGSELRSAVDATSNGTLDQHQVAISDVQTVEGTRVAQTDGSANLTGVSDTSQYQIFSGADDARQIVLTIDTAGLGNESEQTPVVEVDTTGGTIEVDLYKTDDGTVTFEGGDAGCGIDPIDDEVTFDLLHGSINRQPCSEFRVADPVTGVKFENSGTADGTFSMTYLNGNRNAGDVDRVGTPPSLGGRSNPVAHDVVYAASMDLTVVGNNVGQTQPIVVAPGSLQKEVNP